MSTDADLSLRIRHKDRYIIPTFAVRSSSTFRLKSWHIVLMIAISSSSTSVIILFQCKKKEALRYRSASLLNQRLPILPGGLPPSTFGVCGLNCCVRHGNRWIPAAIATEFVSGFVSWQLHKNVCLTCLSFTSFWVLRLVAFRLPVWDYLFPDSLTHSEVSLRSKRFSQFYASLSLL